MPRPPDEHETPLSLLESVDLLGRYRYVELALFGVLGSRAAEEGAPLAPFLAGAARAHAWRAELFEELLPVSVGLPSVGTSTGSPGPAIERALDLLAGAPGPGLLESLVRVLYPAMLSAWRERVLAASRSADPPVLRALRRAASDLEETARDGAELAPRLRAGSGSEAAKIGDELQALLAESGGAFGPLRRSARGSEPVGA